MDNEKLSPDNDGITEEQPLENTPVSELQDAPTSTPDTALGAINPAPDKTSVASTEDIPLATKKKLPKKLLIVAFTSALLLGGGVAAYINFYQKSPEKIWSRGLVNTSEGLEQFARVGLENVKKGMVLDGKVKMDSPIAMDGTLTGQWYETTGSMSANLSVSGARFDAEVRTVTQEGQNAPDIYMKINGVDQIESFIGLSGISEMFNEKWFYVDHTLLQQYALSSSSNVDTTLTQQDLQEIVDKMVGVLKKRMFTSDSQAAFGIGENVGREDFEGTATFKYKVSVNKENLKSFATELKDAAKSTKIESLLKSGNNDNSLEEVMSFDALLRSIDEADFNKTKIFVWVEANGGYVRNIRIYPEQNDEKNYIDIGAKYTGGDVLPLSIKVTVDDATTTGNFAIGMNLNKTNGDASYNLDVNMNSNEQPITMSVQLAMSGSDDKVSVVAPTDATNILEFMGQLQQSQTNLMNDFESSYPDDLQSYDYDTMNADDFQLLQ